MTEIGANVKAGRKFKPVDGRAAETTSDQSAVPSILHAQRLQQLQI